MQFKRRKLNLLIALATAITALCAVGASSALAATHWSDTTHGMKIAGTNSLTVYANGGNAKTCSINASLDGKQPSTLSGASFSVHSELDNTLYLLCTGSTTLSLEFVGEAEAAGGGYQLVFKRSGPWALWAPWGGANSFWQGAEKELIGKFVNGSGTTPSKLVFSSTEIGYDRALERVTATGSLNVTTSTGGLLTLLP